MADDLKCLQHEDQVNVTQLQAWFRGILVRKWMRQLRDEYAAIVQDLEPDCADGYTIEWKQSALHVCKPNIVRSRRKRCQDIKHHKDDVHRRELKSNDLSHIYAENLSIGNASSNVSKYPAIGDKFTADVSSDIINPDPIIDRDTVSHDARSKSVNKKHVTLKDNSEFDSNSVKRGGESEPTALHDEKAVHQARLHEHVHDKQPPCNYNDISMDTNEYDKGRQLTQSIEQSLGHMTDSSSVWDTMEISDIKESDHSSFNCEHDTLTSHLPRDADKLAVIRQHVAMELLWVKQAIQSRKQYLRLKSDMGAEL